VRGGTAPFTYQWRRDGVVVGSESVLTTRQGGIYTVTIQDANACAAVANAFTVTVRSQPVQAVTIGGPTTFCQGGSVRLSVTTPADAAVRWLFEFGPTGGLAGNSINATTSGMYWARVTNACVDTLFQVTQVTVNPVPTVTISGSRVVCRETPTTLSAVVTGGAAPYTYRWRTGEQEVGVNSTVAVQSAGSYRVAVQDQNGCSATSTNYSLSANTLSVSLQGPAAFCTNTSPTLTAAVQGGRSPFGYEWKRNNAVINEVGRSFTLTQGGTYQVGVVDADGCQVAASSVITAFPAPRASAGAGAVLTGTQVYSLTGVQTASGGTAPYRYVWGTTPQVPGQGDTTATPTIGPFRGNTTITLRVTDRNKCEATSSAVINYTPCTFSAVLIGDSSFCTGRTARLRLSLAGGIAPYTYKWFRNGVLQTPNGSTLDASTPGDYSAQVTDSKGCSFTTGIFKVTEITSLPVRITGDPLFCPGGGTTTLSAEVNQGTAPFTFQWTRDNQAAGSTPALQVNLAGSYSLTVRDARGCQGRAREVAVREKPRTPAVITPQGSTEGYVPNKVFLRANLGFDMTYQWRRNGNVIPDATLADYEAAESGLYTVLVTQNGCSTLSEPVQVTISLITALEPVSTRPTGMVLLPSTPNPARQQVEISYRLPQPMSITLQLYSADGRPLQTLDAGAKTAGWHTVRTDVSQLPAGLYFYRLEAGRSGLTRRLLVAD